MIRRSLVLRVFMGGIAVVLLASCTAVIAGTGTRAATTPRSGSGPTSGSSSPTPAGKPPSLLRTKLSGGVGALPTANLCHGIPLGSLRQWGRAIVHGWQTAGTCYIDIGVSSSQWFQLNTWISEPGGFDPGAGRP